MSTQLRHPNGSISMACLSTGLGSVCGTKSTGGLCPQPHDSIGFSSNYELTSPLTTSLWTKSETLNNPLLFPGSHKPWRAPLPSNLVSTLDHTHQFDPGSKSIYYPGQSPIPFDRSSPGEARVIATVADQFGNKNLTTGVYTGQPANLSDPTGGSVLLPHNSDLNEPTDMAKLLDDTNSPSEFTLQNRSSDPDTVEGGSGDPSIGPPRANTSSTGLHLLDSSTIHSTEPYSVPTRTPYLNQLFCAKALFCESTGINQSDLVGYPVYMDDDDADRTGDKLVHPWNRVPYERTTNLPASRDHQLHHHQSTPEPDDTRPTGRDLTNTYSHTLPQMRMESFGASGPLDEGSGSPYEEFSPSNTTNGSAQLAPPPSQQIAAAAYVAAAVAAASVSHQSRCANPTTTTATTASAAHMNYLLPGSALSPHCPASGLASVTPHPTLINTHRQQQQQPATTTTPSVAAARISPYEVKQFAGHPTVCAPFPFHVPNPYMTGGHAPPPPPPPQQQHSTHAASIAPHGVNHAQSSYGPYPPLRHFGPHPGQPSYGFGLDGTRRKNATRESTTTLKVWLQEHIKNPYPSKGEKIMLAIITKMTLTQVSTWFANARRRLKKENKMSWHQKTNNSNNAAGRGSPATQHSGSARDPSNTGKKSCDSAESHVSQDDLGRRIRANPGDDVNDDDPDDLSGTDEADQDDEDAEEMNDDVALASGRDRYMKAPITRDDEFHYESMGAQPCLRRQSIENTDYPLSGTYTRPPDHQQIQSRQLTESSYSNLMGSHVGRFHPNYSHPFPPQPMIDLMRSIPPGTTHPFPFRDHVLSGPPGMDKDPSQSIKPHPYASERSDLLELRFGLGHNNNSVELNSEMEPRSTLFGSHNRFMDSAMGYCLNPFTSTGHDTSNSGRLHNNLSHPCDLQTYGTTFPNGSSDKVTNMSKLC